MSFKSLTESMENKLLAAQEGVTAEMAEKLAFEFLSALLKVSAELRKADMNSRMRKSSVKSLRAALYLDIVQKSEKKPTEAAITAVLDTDSLVTGEQNGLDEAEVDKAELMRLEDIYKNAHILLRGLAKGNSL